MLKHILRGVGAALVLSLGLHAQTGLAQSPFDPVVRVNESVITRFEVDQRFKFLTLLRQPGLTRQSVIDTLIDEKLQLAEAKRLGIEMTEDQVQASMTEFAARANLSSDEFLAAIGQQGVAPETFRDFVQAGTAWRDAVRRRFGSRARVSEDELNRAIALGTGQGSVQVELAEIVLPLMPETAADVRQQADAIQQMKSFGEFSTAARNLSASPTADQGGSLGWMPLSKLPEQIAPLFLSMAPGDVTPPLPLPNVNAIALFQLRGLRDSRPGILKSVTLDYMLVRTAQGQATATMTRISPKLSTCDSLFSNISDPQGKQIQHVTEARDQTPANLVGVLDRLDPGELGALPGDAAFVMLCNRTPILGADLSRDDLQQRLFVRKLEDLAGGYMAELRANAFIEKLE